MKHPFKVTLLFFCTIACGSGGYVDDEATLAVAEPIVGGNEATPGEWPTAVNVQYQFSSLPPWYCGGTIISPTAIATAKHCVDSGVVASQLTVVAGRHVITSSGGTTHAVSNIILHPTADAALLLLATPITGVTPTRLVAKSRMSEIPAGSTTTVVGWGDLSFGGVPSETLQEVEVEVLGVGADCDAVSDYTGIQPDEICIGDLAGGQDSCQGDSGGPAFIRRDGEQFLLGMTSTGQGCALPNLPGIYAFVPEVFDWLHDNTPDEPRPSLLPSAQIMAL